MFCPQDLLPLSLPSSPASPHLPQGLHPYAQLCLNQWATQGLRHPAPISHRPQPHASHPLVDLPTQTHLPPTTPHHPITMGWVGLLGLLQLGALQPPTITIGQAVLLQEDIITHRAVLHLAKLSLLQVDITTIVLPVLLEVDTTTIVLPVLQVDTTTVVLPVLQVDPTTIVLPILQVDTTTIVLPVLPVDTTTIGLPVLPVDTTTIGLPVPLQVDTTAIGQQPTAESRSLSG